MSLFASFFLTVVNIALFYEIHDGTKDGCVCGACRVLGLFLSAVGVVVNVVVFGVAFVTILFSSTRPDVQCPLKRGKTSEAASVEADNVVQ